MSDREQTAFEADLDEELGSDYSAEELTEEEWSDEMADDVDQLGADEFEAGAEVYEDEEPVEEPEPESGPASDHSETSAPPMVLGMLFFLATVAAAVGMGYGVMVALGGSLSQLLQIGGLLDFDQILKFDQNPSNVFWMLALAVVILAMLVSGAVARVVKKVRQQSIWRQALLDRLTSLTLDSDEGWHAEALQDDPAVAAFAANILHEWRVVQGKLARSISQDAELRRLEKALIDNTRVDMAGGFESPAVGSLADEVLRQFDDRMGAERERQSMSKALADQGLELVSLITDARSWNIATLDQISVQGAALERLGVKANKLAEAARQLGDSISGEDRRAGLARLQDELASIPLNAEPGETRKANPELREVAERASKLTFKITMEVARLGTKGERLLPLTQALEELTSGFRDLADSGGGTGVAHNELAAALGRLGQQIATLQESEDGVGALPEAWQGLVDSAGEIAPLSRQISEKLASIARDFNQQTERLATLGTRYGELTGVDFDPEDTTAGNPANPPTGELEVQRHDPFGGTAKEPESPSLVADPFAGASDSPFGDLAPTAAADSDSQFGSIMEPEVAPMFQDEQPEAVPEVAAQPEAAPEPGLVLDSPASQVEVPSGPEPAAEAPLGDEAAPNPAAGDDKVYELAEFGAVPVSTEAGQERTVEDRIYDLEEFGAVAIG